MNKPWSKRHAERRKKQARFKRSLFDDAYPYTISDKGRKDATGRARMKIIFNEKPKGNSGDWLNMIENGLYKNCFPVKNQRFGGSHMNTKGIKRRAHKKIRKDPFATSKNYIIELQKYNFILD